MIKFGFVKYFAVAIAFIFVSCEESTTQAVREKMLVVDASANIPECQSENEGEFVFVKGESATRVCSDGKWVDPSKREKDTVYVKEGSKKIYVSGKLSCETVSLPDDSGIKIICNGDSVGVVLNGRNGDDGVDGTNGTNGKDGKDGTDGKRVSGEKGVDGEDGKNGSDGVGCSVTDMDSIVVVVCGEDSVGIYKEACGVKPYDPETHFCDSRDERIYRYVTIGSQVWMAENLNYVIDYETDSLSGFSWCFPDADSCERFGRYYSWSVAMDAYEIFSDNGRGCFVRTKCMAEYPVRGICPKGWHLPDTTDWNILDDFVNDDYRALQAKGFPAWALATDEYGFSVLPTGFLFCRFGNVVNIGNVGTNMAFWTITESDADKALAWDIDDHRLPAFRSYEKINMAYPIRCLRDDSQR